MTFSFILFSHMQLFCFYNAAMRPLHRQAGVNSAFSCGGACRRGVLRFPCRTPVLPVEQPE